MNLGEFFINLGEFLTNLGGDHRREEAALEQVADAAVH